MAIRISITPSIEHKFLQAAQDRNLEKVQKMLHKYGSSLVKATGSITQKGEGNVSIFANLQTTGNALIQALVGKIFRLESSSESSQGENLVRLIQFLIENGCDVNQKSDAKQTPLHLAFEMNNQAGMRIAEMLLNLAADPASVDASARLPIDYLRKDSYRFQAEEMCGIVKPHFREEAKEKISRQLEKNRIKLQVEQSIKAIDEHDSNKIFFLLLDGMSPHISFKKNGENSLCGYAILQGKEEIVRVFFQFGIDTTIRYIHNGNPYSFLALTIFNENEKTVEVLLDHGADPNEKVNLQGTEYCIWQLHALLGYTKTVSLFLKKGAQRDAKIQNVSLKEFLEINPQDREQTCRHIKSIFSDKFPFWKQADFIITLSDALDRGIKEFKKILLENKSVLHDPEVSKNLQDVFSSFKRQAIVLALKVDKKIEKKIDRLCSGSAEGYQEILKLLG